MTKQENFKRRVRARMAKTGERYAAARSVLIEQRTTSAGRRWVSDPDFTDAVVLGNTGHDWDHWCDLIDAWRSVADGRDGHTAIATYLREDEGVDPWWAQGLTVGYERIVGLRLPFQRADGTFTVNKSKTILVEAGSLREMLLDDQSRGDLMPGIATELRSKPASKSIRLGINPGYALITIEAKEPGRAKVTVAHEQLPTFDEVDEWKFFWGDWLDALDES